VAAGCVRWSRGEGMRLLCERALVRDYEKGGGYYFIACVLVLCSYYIFPISLLSSCKVLQGTFSLTRTNLVVSLRDVLRRRRLFVPETAARW